MGFLANPIAVWILFIVCVILLVVAFIQFLDSEFGSAVLFGGLMVIAGFAWHYGATHRVVPPNQRWLVINTANGEVDGETRTSGIIKKPFALYQINKYPGASEQPACIDYTPALQEGYEILTHICFVYDASALDWEDQFSDHNFTTETQMLSYWSDQTKEQVSTSLMGVNYTEIVTNRAGVATKIRESLIPWFDEIGVSVSNIQLSNWDFTNPDVKAAVNQASAASMRSTIEKQLFEASKLARERQIYETTTSNLVLEERGKGLESLFQSLNITDDAAKAYLASQMTWYTYAQNPPAGVQIILGIGGNPIAVPLNVPQAAPQAAP